MQTLTRHGDLKVFMDRYAKARENRLQKTVADAIGEAVLPVENCAMDVQRVAAGAEGQLITGSAATLQR